jgi:hypothetical protein
MPKHRTGYSKSERFVEISIQNKSVPEIMSERSSTTTSIIRSNVKNQSTDESTCETSVSASAQKITLGNNNEMSELTKVK